MRRLLALMGVMALVVAFSLPMAGTADAASHAKKNPCAAKEKAKDMMKKNPCATNPCATKASNPCNPCGKKKGMGDKAKEMGKKTMDKMKK